LPTIWTISARCGPPCLIGIFAEAQEGCRLAHVTSDAKFASARRAITSAGASVPDCVLGGGRRSRGSCHRRGCRRSRTGNGEARLFGRACLRGGACPDARARSGGQPRPRAGEHHSGRADVSRTSLGRRQDRAWPPGERQSSGSRPELFLDLVPGLLVLGVAVEIC
jgi:hypothetical protein